ncbi:PTS sugar transporter subunit IIA [Streptococcus equi]|uniref:PTS system, N-acetylgalactosamine-and galactosamine-specific IIA component AgaA n=1 Tax=Streptococcus equi subsp. ruminatorum CECT 5772 TaxID=1051981 RepID=A0A922NSS9_9STRE|nr:PTS sugar transporter subunit IIA [Streptococcus equi]HEL1011198.1 PTS sugar transporter subunit IIA [Streptococcus equi subsp. ruminatorum]KED03547.1 PTS system, N-acetylgalactosamine- and galactosamine-specific IIA component AgaA [Streptococcus equi subsp. ruminatorum CECT 5772]WKF65886.1 PTS sugar transporter subunit IIA [Streptococcus equi subsp. zooepidemicus]SUN53010.1 N-acetylgalactosamine-specific phosphotransferase system (PTS), IIA component [Streptococcus equi subsp. zooepidemicus
MISIIVIGHGHFASGIVSSLELIAGKQEGITAIDFTAEMTAADVHERLSAVLQPKAQALVLCDLLGGTPFKVAATLMEELSETTLDVLSGLNLAMLMEAVFARQEQLDLEQTVAKLLTTAKEGISNWKSLSSEADEADLDEGGI